MREKLMLAGFAAILFLSACGAKGNEPKESQEPSAPSSVTAESEQEEQKTQPDEAKKVVIENGGRTLTFEKVPERAVSIELGPTQILLALGLEDKIHSVALSDSEYNDCLPEYRDKLLKLKSMIKGLPNFELLLSNEPDFVYGTIYAFGEKLAGKIEDFEKEHIPVYCMTGTCSETPSIADVYKDIADLGKIFRKEEEASALIAKYREREEALKKASAGREVRVLGYDSGDKEAGVAGNGIESEIFRLAGGVNVYGELAQSYAFVNWEDLAVKNPELIVIHNYAPEMMGTAEDKIKMLKEHPALANVDAVKNDRFVVVSLAEVFPGLQVFDAAERIQAKIQEIRAAK